ncbi:hypothetical protein AGMMS49936_03390 [Endomicrobiia bacterium]|nr:hypothetical protein AGMMS49936_03390 [Endomicrobiia bacterium]
MLKKMVMVFCSIFFFGCFVPSVSLARNRPNNDDKMDIMGKNVEGAKDFFSKLDVLLTDYSAAVDSKKDAIKKDISELVASRVDEIIKVVKKQKTNRATKKALDSIEADRKKYASDKVDYFTSAKGQAEAHKKKEQFNKKKATRTKKTSKTNRRKIKIARTIC